MQAKTIKKYINLVNSKEVITESQIRSLKQFINRLARGGAVLLDGKEVNYTQFLTFKPKRITAEQSLKGINWLKYKLLKMDGTPRRANPLNLSDYHKEMFIKVLNNFKEWRFMGFDEIEQVAMFAWYAPIYRMIAKNGDYIQYSVTGMGLLCSSNVNSKKGL